jgi:hypothetical protein
MQIKYSLIVLFLLLPFSSSAKKIKYLKIDLLNIVLVSENNKLVNDSTALSVVKNYFRRGTMSLEISDYQYTDTLISIVMNNKDFFRGLGYKDIELLFGKPSEGGNCIDVYKMIRLDLKTHLEQVVLMFFYENLKVTEMVAPYISMVSSINICYKPTLWHRLFPKKDPLWRRPF